MGRGENPGLAPARYNVIRRLLLVLCVIGYFVFFFQGCRSIEQSYQALEACKRDPVCFGQMEKGSDLASAITVAGSSVVPQVAPYGNVLGSFVGMLVSLCVGVWLGRKKKVR